MVGRTVQLRVQKERATPGESVLEARDLGVADDRGHVAVDGVSFDVRAGEILTLAGVQGNGQTELVEALTGLRHPLTGTIIVSGRDLTNRSPHDAILTGVAHVPEDRQREGLFFNLSVRHNLVMPTAEARRTRLVRRSERETSARYPEYGFAANRQTIETMVQYCYEQGVTTKRLDPERVFLLTDT